MATETKPIDIEGLKHYRSVNPVKFMRKFGEVDFDNLPVGFNIHDYKTRVVAERVRRTKMNLPENDPMITPELFYSTEVPKQAVAGTGTPVRSDVPDTSDESIDDTANTPEVAQPQDGTEAKPDQLNAVA